MPTLRGLLKVTILLLFSITLISCIDTANPLRSFTVDELAGTWRAEYKDFKYFDVEVTGVETFTLKTDGTYQQAYDDGKGYKYVSSWNKWRLEGGRRLYFEGARFYALGIRDAESWTPNAVHTFIAHDFERIDLKNEIVLFVYPTSLYPGGAYLYTPLVGDLDAPKWARFYRVLDSTNSVVPSQQPEHTTQIQGVNPYVIGFLVL